MVPSPSLPSRRRQRLKRVAQATGISLLISGFGIGASSGSDLVEDQADLPTYPQTGLWNPLRATSLNYAGTAKQWIQLPSMMTSAFNRTATNLTSPCTPGSNLYPYATRTGRSAAVHFKSSAGAPSSYGYVGPFTVKTVAFGSIPVEAQVQIQQLRDADSRSVGLEFRSVEGTFCPGQGPFGNDSTFHVRNVQIQGEVNVAVTKLAVDGINLRLRGACKTAQPSSFHLTSPEYFQVKRTQTTFEYFLEPDPAATPLPDDQIPAARNLMTMPVFQPVSGGLLTGNVSISRFANCLTDGGEDVSRLLTATVSGDSNPVQTRSEGLQTDPTSYPQGTPFPQLPIPTSAP